MNAEHASKILMSRPTFWDYREGCYRPGVMSDAGPAGWTGVVAMAWIRRRPHATRETPSVEARDLQPAIREDQAGLFGVAERSVVLMTPGNAGRGKGP